MSLLVLLLAVSEPLLRGSQLFDIQRLVRTLEQSNDPEHVGEAASQLELLQIYDLAIEGHEQVARLRPSLAHPHIHLAALYGILRRFRDAEEASRRALSIDPQSSGAHFYLAMATLEQGKMEEARELFERARSLGLPEVQATIADNALRRLRDERVV